MSRKGKGPKDTRQGGGYVEFVGLRYFLAASEGRVSRKELVKLIRQGFDSRGLKVPEGFKVEFRMTRRPTSEIDGAICSIWGQMHPCKDRVEIYLLDRAGDPESFPTIMNTIGHELDHVWWEKEGKEFDDSLPYKDRPHEIRARATGAKWQRWAEARM